MNPAEMACAVAGGGSALAKKLGVTPQAVSDWCRRSVIPPRRVLQVEAALEGRLSRHELAPELYGEKPMSLRAPVVERHTEDYNPPPEPRRGIMREEKSDWRSVLINKSGDQ